MIANDLLKHIKAIDDLVSTPSPDEIAWVNTEREASKRDIHRLARFLDNPTFQQYKLKEYLSGLQISLLNIVRA